MISEKDLKKKNILFVTHQYAHFQKDYIEEVSKYFNQVYVFVRYKPLAQIYRLFHLSVFANHAKDNAIDLTNTPPNIHVTLVPVFYLPLDFFYRLIGDWQFKKINSYIKKDAVKFDIIHSHFLWTSGYVGAKLKKLYSKPLVLTSHSPSQVSSLVEKSNFWKNKIDYVISTSDLVLAVNKEMALKLTNIYPNASIKYSPNGYNSTLFYPGDLVIAREKLGLPKEVKIILSIGFLDKIKGHHILIPALLKVSKHTKNFICVIIGSGKRKAHLFHLVKSYKLNNRVFLHERVPHNEIVTWLQASNILVTPSLEESFGIVQIEAMACGKPIVSSETTGSKGIIKSDKVGLLCKKDDYIDLASKIAEALNKSWDQNVICEYADKYKLENIIKEVIKMYANLL